MYCADSESAVSKMEDSAVDVKKWNEVNVIKLSD